MINAISFSEMAFIILVSVRACAGILFTVLTVEFSDFFLAVHVVVVELIIFAIKGLLYDGYSLHRSGIFDKYAHINFCSLQQI